MDTGVDSTSVRDDQRWWQSDQEGISLLATAAGAAVELPYFHDDAAWNMMMPQSILRRMELQL
eukprot:scaffold261583_cov39-Attheya_sp.AAC.1